jgi:Holliday junction resolvase
MLTRYERQIAIGGWGERRASILLKGAGFSAVRDLNEETHNHPFGDIYAERGGTRYLIGVKARNKYTDKGRLNETYNIRKKHMDVRILADRHKAELSWVTIQVVPELQSFWAFFGTIVQNEKSGERFSIRMKPKYTKDYECLGEGRDVTIRSEWSNGGYPLSRDYKPPT